VWSRFSEDDFSTGREREAEIFLEMTNGSEFVLGRGLGAAYCGCSASITGTASASFTSGMHLMLKGLVLLLLLGRDDQARSWARAKTAFGAVAPHTYAVCAPKPRAHAVVASGAMALFGLTVGVALNRSRKRPSAMTCA
jgi:hypothetical protein